MNSPRWARTSKSRPTPGSKPPPEPPAKFSTDWFKDVYRRYKGTRGLLLALVAVSVAAFLAGVLAAFNDKGKETTKLLLDGRSGGTSITIAMVKPTIDTCGYADDTLFASTDSLKDAPALAAGDQYVTWWRAHGGIAMSRAFAVTVQSPSTEAIVLTGLRVVIDRSTPATGARVEDHQCGGGFEPRYFEVDLAGPRSTVKALPEARVDQKPSQPAVSFPFKVSRDDPEVFNFAVKDDPGRDDTWHLELDWVDNGKRGTSRIGDAGGFRTSGARLHCALAQPVAAAQAGNLGPLCPAS